MNYPDLQILGEKFKETRSEKDYNSLHDPLDLYLNSITSKRWKWNKSYAREEAIQITKIKVWEKIDQYDPDKAKFVTWVSTILQRELQLASFGRKKNLKVIPNNWFSEDILKVLNNKFYDENDAFVDENNWKLGDLESAIKVLPDDVRDLVWDKYVEKLSYKEMYDKYLIPINTMKTRVRRGVYIMKGEATSVSRRHGNAKSWFWNN